MITKSKVPILETVKFSINPVELPTTPTALILPWKTTGPTPSSPLVFELLAKYRKPSVEANVQAERINIVKGDEISDYFMLCEERALKPFSNVDQIVLFLQLYKKTTEVKMFFLFDFSSRGQYFITLRVFNGKDEKGGYLLECVLGFESKDQPIITHMPFGTPGLIVGLRD